jgi:hypothetical protein
VMILTPKTGNGHASTPLDELVNKNTRTPTRLLLKADEHRREELTNALLVANVSPGVHASIKRSRVVVRID